MGTRSTAGWTGGACGPVSGLHTMGWPAQRIERGPASELCGSRRVRAERPREDDHAHTHDLN
jgi:hypothetical protein